jgi:hypothetical protein
MYLNDYISDDIIKYILNEYISHYPDDMIVIESVFKKGFKLNIDKYIYLDKKF